MVGVTTETCILGGHVSLEYRCSPAGGCGRQVGTVHLCLHTCHVWCSDPVTKVSKSNLVSPCVVSAQSPLAVVKR